jgi:hypothetical protein
MSISIQKSLTQLTELSVLDHLGPKYPSEPDLWMEHHDMTNLKRLQKEAKKAKDSALVEYRNALSAFKSTHETQALAEYTGLMRTFPLYHEYVQILEKLKTIFALPDMLNSYIQTPTVETAKDITDKCRSILRDHERRDYDPLFQPSKYLDLQGRQKQPKYGKWTYNAKEYEMKKMIEDIQNNIS